MQAYPARTGVLQHPTLAPGFPIYLAPQKLSTSSSLQARTPGGKGNQTDLISIYRGDETLSNQGLGTWDSQGSLTSYNGQLIHGVPGAKQVDSHARKEEEDAGKRTQFFPMKSPPLFNA